MSQSTAVAGSETLELLFEAVRTSNPFLSDRVNEPSDKDADVPGIHQTESETLIHLAQTCLRERTAMGAMLLGGAGVGKSHLLSRFWRWAKQGDRAYYLFLHNVLASPERMPRHFLRYLMSMLARSSDTNRDSDLYKLLHEAIKNALKDAGLSSTTSPSKCKQAFLRLADGFKVQTEGVRRPILEMLFAYFRIVNTHPQRHGLGAELAAAVVGWLSGDSLDPAQAEKIGFDADSLITDAEGAIRLCDNHHVQEVVLVLTELAALVGKPFVVCIDQVDNLEDPQVKSLSRFLHALLDSARNLLVVTSGVRETMVDKFQEQRVIPEASWDRLADRLIDLRRIDAEKARQILSERLKPFHQRFGKQDEVKRLLSQHEFFPLSTKEFELHFGEALEIRPRDVIKWAREQWNHEKDELASKGGSQWLKEWASAATTRTGSEVVSTPLPPVELPKLIDECVHAKIRESISQRREHKGALPPDHDNLATLVESLLTHCLSQEERYSLRSVQRSNDDRSPFQLQVREVQKGGTQEVLNGICFITTRDGRTSNAALRRLLKVDGQLDHRILVTDEERAPLPMPEQGKKLYNELRRLGKDQFLHIKLDFQQYAELDALHGVIAQARVGDLEVDCGPGKTHRVTEEEVVESLHRQDVFRKHPLLGELTQEPPSGGTITTVVLPEKDVRETVMGNLSWKIAMSTNEIANIYLDLHDDLDISFDNAHRQIMHYCLRLAEEKRVIAKEHDGALIVLLPAEQKDWQR